MKTSQTKRALITLPVLCEMLFFVVLCKSQTENHTFPVNLVKCDGSLILFQLLHPQAAFLSRICSACG